MGVYIKNMEMPKNCHECRLYEGDIYYCSAADKMIDISDSSAEKCQFCPLAPVPPHGRLGDLDELEKSFREDADAEWNRFATPLNWADAFDDVADIVADAPTIIPAEEGDT